MSKVTNVAIFSAYLLGISACQGGYGSMGEPGGASHLTAITMGLPDVAAFGVAQAANFLNGYRLVVEPDSTPCDSPTRVDETKPYGRSASLAQSLKQGCGYRVTLALGHLDPTGRMDEVYYRNNPPENLSREALAGKPQVGMKLRLALQPDGQRRGFPAALSTTGTLPPSNATPTQPPGESFPAQFDMPLSRPGVTGQKLSQVFTQQYLILELTSGIYCGGCMQLARELDRDTAFQALLGPGKKCELVSIVLDSAFDQTLQSLGGSSFSAQHMYTTPGSYTAAAQKFRLQVTAVPMAAIVDRTGKVVDQAVGTWPRQAQSLCGGG